jgi:putative nucleotidyltransferase with HDIG domain
MSRIRHLLRRFFEVLTARPLSPREQTEAASLLQDPERDIFWRQPAADQRHGLEAARRVLSVAPGRRDLARAALLHDVGKRHAGLGVIGRSLASGLELLHLPAPGRLDAYLRHGPIGAEELRSAGAEDLVVAFTEHHHGERPADIPEDHWALLLEADGE